VVGRWPWDPDRWVHFTSLPKCDQSVTKLCDAARKSANTAFGGVVVSFVRAFESQEIVHRIDLEVQIKSKNPKIEELYQLQYLF
jgi:hypothetical protein